MSGPPPLPDADAAALRAAAGAPPEAYLYPVTVEPGDIDELGHVNNAVYVRWMDRAAVAHSAALGFDWPAYQRLGAAFVVRRHQIDYRGMAYAGDRLAVVTWPSAAGRATAQRRHRILRVGGETPLVEAVTDWAFVALATGRPTRIPEAVLAAFKPFV